MAGKPIIILNCKICDKNTTINISPLDRVFNNEQHFYLCVLCKTNTKCYSYTECIKDLLFKQNELNNLKYLYFNNVNNKTRLYMQTDVKILTVNNNQILDDRIKVKKYREDMINKTKTIRREELKHAFSQHKLEIYNYGDCYSYINYGNPDLSIIVNNELKKVELVNERRNILIAEFKKRHVDYNEKYDYVKKYIYDINNKSIELDEIIKMAELDNFFIKETNYVSLSKIHDKEKARELALKTYLETKPKKKIIKNINKIIIDFE